MISTSHEIFIQYSSATPCGQHRTVVRIWHFITINCDKPTIVIILHPHAENMFNTLRVEENGRGFEFSEMGMFEFRLKNQGNFRNKRQWNLYQNSSRNCFYKKMYLIMFAKWRPRCLSFNVFKRNVHDGVIKWKHFPRYWFFCAGNSPVTGEFPSQRPVTRSFDVFFDLRLNKRFGK